MLDFRQSSINFISAAIFLLFNFNDEGINNVVNLSSEEFSQEETNLLNQGLKSCVGFCTNVKTYHLHLKLANYLGIYIWENLEYNI